MKNRNIFSQLLDVIGIIALTGAAIAMGAALWFAAGLLCAQGPGRPCGVCGPCKRVSSGGNLGNHPDLLVIDPIEDGEERIRVARIAQRSDGDADDRSLEAFLDLRALEGGYRPVIVRESHRNRGLFHLQTVEELKAEFAKRNMDKERANWLVSIHIRL